MTARFGVFLSTLLAVPLAGSAAHARDSNFPTTVPVAVTEDPVADLGHPLMADDMETLQGVTGQSMAQEMTVHAKQYRIATTAGGVKDIRAEGNASITEIHMPTNYGYSDHRNLRW